MSLMKMRLLKPLAVHTGGREKRGEEEDTAMKGSDFEKQLKTSKSTTAVCQRLQTSKVLRHTCSGNLPSMGCASSRDKGDDNTKRIRKPKPWKHSEPITRAQLKQMRDEFWDTAPHYGGRKEIWDALRAATEADLSLAQAIIDSAGVIVQNPDLTVCYDERGAKYELPKYALSEPSNLIQPG
ncbi:Ubiquitin domain-containing protein [Drosera capensis]